MSYNAKIYNKQGGDELVIEDGGKITEAGIQASTIDDLTITADLTGVADGTDMTATQASAIETDLAAVAAKLNAVLAALEGVGILAKAS